VLSMWLRMSETEEDSESNLVGAEIAKRLAEMGKTQKSFAEEIEMQQGSLSEIIRGKRKLPLGKVPSLSKNLGDSEDYWRALALKDRRPTTRASSELVTAQGGQPQTYDFLLPSGVTIKIPMRGSGVEAAKLAMSEFLAMMEIYNSSTDAIL